MSTNILKHSLGFGYLRDSYCLPRLHIITLEKKKQENSRYRLRGLAQVMWTCDNFQSLSKGGQIVIDQSFC